MSAFLRSVFWVLLAVEIVSCILLLTTGLGGGFGIVFFLFPMAAGFGAGLLGVIFKPHPLSAFVLLGFNLVALALFFNLNQIEGYRDSSIHRQEKEKEAIAQRHANEVKQLAHLIRHGQIEQAKQWLATHKELPLRDPEWLAYVFCRFGEPLPDRALLTQIRDYAKLRDGDLLRAAASCSRRATQRVLDIGVSPEAMDSDGTKALMTGTDVESLALLLDRGASPESRARSDGMTALMFHRAPEITRLLLAHGAKPDTLNYRKDNVLFFCGPPEVLRDTYLILLDAGADPNYRASPESDTALLYHARVCKDDDVAQLLVEHGADPNVRDSNGKTPLLHAMDKAERFARYLKLPRLDLAAAQGADALIGAVHLRSEEMIGLLLAAGVNPLAVSTEGESTLDYYRKYRLFHNTRAEDPLYGKLLDAAARFGAVPVDPIRDQ